MWKARSLQSWFKISRLWDTFYAYCHGGIVAARSIVREIATFTQQVKKRAKKARSFQPRLEILETRYAPATWDGGGGMNTNWNTAANWLGDVVPGSGDDVTIGNYTVILDANASVDDLTLGGTTLTGSGTMLIAGTSSLTGSVTLDDVEVGNSGAMTWSGAGTLTLSGGAGLYHYTGASFVWTSSGNLTIGSGSTVINYGVFDVQTGADLVGGGSFTNEGTFQKTSGAVTDVSVDFINSGVTTAAGTGHGLNFSGTVTLGAGTFIETEFDGATASGTGGTFEDVKITDATIDVWFILNFDGNSSWIGGSVEGSGTVVVSADSTLSISGNDSKSLGSNLQNSGTIDWTEGDISIDDIYISNYNEFSIPAGYDLTGVVNSLFYNYGTVILSAGTFGASQLDVDFIQSFSGTLSVDIKQKTGSEFDRLIIGGMAELDGDLEVNPLAGYAVIGKVFTFLTADSITGTFDNVTVGSFGAGSSPVALYDLTSASVYFRPTVAFTTASQIEDEDIGTMDVIVQLSGPSELTVTVPFTVSGSATLTDDFTISPTSSVMISSGTTATITLTIVDDSLNETKETVILTMGSPTNAALGTTTVHKARIVDNDAADAVNDSDSTSEDTDLVIAADDLLSNDNDPAVLVIIGWSQPTTPHGTLECDGTHFTYKPHANYVGSDSFTYTVKDGDGDTDTATVTITVNGANDAPIAKNDWTNGPSALNTPMTIWVLANDSDLDLGDSFWISSVTNGSSGTVAIAVDNLSLTYEQTANFLGDDTFTYTITDGEVYATATVTVTIGAGQWASYIYDSPGDPDDGVSSEWTASGPYAWYAVQALGTPNTLEYGDITTAWAPEPQDNAGTHYLTVGFDTPKPARGFLIRETYGNGFVTQLDLLRWNSGTSTWVWENSYWTGTDTSPSNTPHGFVIDFGSATAYDVKAVRIHVATGSLEDGEWEEIDAVKMFSSTTPSFTNAAPSISSNPYTPTAFNEDASVTINVSSLATDTTGPFTIRITSDPLHGWVEINDNNTPTNLSDDFLTYTPDPDYNDDPGLTPDDTFDYEVLDIWGVPATGTVNITVSPQNDAPYLEPVIYANAYKSAALTIDVLDYADDIDGDPLQLSVPSGTTPNGTVSVNNNGTPTVYSDDRIVYTPTTGYTGQDKFTVSVSDGTASATATVYVTVFEDGHWATTTDVSLNTSQYADNAADDWGYNKVFGAPDTFEYGDSASAWAAADMNSSTPQQLVYGFGATPQATGVLIREVNGNGFLTKIELLPVGSSTWQEIWPGATGQSDPATAGKRTDVIVRFPETAYNVQKVRLTINTNHDLDAWEEIDAVRLLIGGAPSSTTISTSAFNNAPMAADDTATMIVGSPVEIPVLANDFDANGDTLSVSAKTNGTFGTVAITGTGNTSVTYTFTGTAPTTTPVTDSFTYTVSDGNGGTATATVNVTIYPAGEWATSVIAYSSQNVGNDYTGLSMQALGSPNDRGWSPQNNVAGTQTLLVGFATPDAATGLIVRGSAGVTQVEVFYGTSYTTADLTLSAGAFTEVSGDLYVNFGGSTAPDEVTAVRITVDTAFFPSIDAIRLLTVTEDDPTNTAPIGTNYVRSAPENTPITIAAGNGASDADGDPLHLEFISAAHGSVEINLGLDPDDVADDYLVYHPDQYFNGSDTINYRVVDIWGAYHARTVSVTITSVNQAPIAVDDEAVTEVETAVPITVLANDFDPDDDDLTVQNPSNGAHGTTSVIGNVITYTPATSYTGRDSFTYEIDDGEGHVTIGTVHVFVYAGQWATHVIDTGSNTSLAEGTVLGAPDTFASGTASAWSPEGATAFDWVTVGFDPTDAAMGVLVRETAGQGFIRRVDLLDTTGVFHTVWAGIDPSGSGITEFIVTFPTVAYDVEGVRVYLDGQSGAAIDAIRLLTHDAPLELTLKTRTFAGANVIVTEYDDESRPIEETVYAGSDIVQTTEMAYDATEGFLETVLVTDALDRQTQTNYDEDGNKLTETFAYGTADASTTTYAYTDGKLTSLTDPKGNETAWAYVGNTVTMTDYFSNDEVKTYDNAGKLLSILTRNNKLRTFEYDADGRLETETWYDGPTTGAAVVEELEWTYTASGQVHTAENSVGTYTFTYNASGQVTKVQEPFGVWLQFGYDSAGHRTLVLDSFGGKEESLYDAQGQLVRRILTKGGDTLRLDQTFDHQGRVLTQTRYSDAAGTTLVGKSEYKYDLQGRVTEIKHKDDGLAVLAEYDYVYDEAGQLDSWTNQQDGIDSGTPWTLDYSYDEQGQLTSDGTINYDYDAGGNRDTGYTYVADGLNDTNLIETAGGYTYEYDDEGNVTKKEHSSGMDTWVYEYDHARHLTAVRWYNSVTVGTGTLRLDVEYSYDVFGNRAQKVVDDDRAAPSSPVTYKYAMDGWNPAKPSPIGNENYDVWADLNSGGSLLTKYLRGDVVDQLWARIDGSDPRWVLTDHLGSVRDVVDDTGSLVDSIAYDSFGNVVEESDPGDAGRYMWTGREFDVETQLQYNRARYYDTQTGRWISQDPMGFESGDSNLYRYATNSPSLLFDPAGLQQTGLEYYRGVFGRPFPGRKAGIFDLSPDLALDTQTTVSPRPFSFDGGTTTGLSVARIESLDVDSGLLYVATIGGPHAAEKNYDRTALNAKSTAANGGLSVPLKAKMFSGLKTDFQAIIADPNEAKSYYWYQEVKGKINHNSTNTSTNALAKKFNNQWKDDDDGSKRYAGQTQVGNKVTMVDLPGIQNILSSIPKDAFRYYERDNELVFRPTSSENYTFFQRITRKELADAGFSAHFEFKTHLMYRAQGMAEPSRKGTWTWGYQISYPASGNAPPEIQITQPTWKANM